MFLAAGIAAAVLAGAAPTTAASNAWFKWGGTAPIVLTVRVSQADLLASFQRAAAAWNVSDAFELTVVQETRCPAVRQISVCSDPAGTKTDGNPAATQPVLVNQAGVSATIWVYDAWVARVPATDHDYMACHELGHAIGLAHQTVNDSCMSYDFARSLPNAQDYRTLAEMYGLPAPRSDPAGLPGPVAPTPAAPAAPAPSPLPSPTPQAPRAARCEPSYWTGPAAAPEVFTYGDAAYHGSTAGVPLTRPIVGMAATPSGNGYWTVGSDGGIFTFGDARFLGSTGAVALHRPIVGMAATPSGNGYWLVASDGGMFAFGDARFLGSTGGMTLHRPVVGMAATPTGNGYWLVASDGGIFAFGDARFRGSTGNIALNQPIVAMASSPSGAGYRLYAADGGIFTFGDAAFLGSGVTLGLREVVGVAATPTGNGYWMATASGAVAAFGDAACHGSLPATLETRPWRIQTIVAAPSGGGYWLAVRRTGG